MEYIQVVGSPDLSNRNDAEYKNGIVLFFNIVSEESHNFFLRCWLDDILPLRDL
jgi:hypothetical protein